MRVNDIGAASALTTRPQRVDYIWVIKYLKMYYRWWISGLFRAGFLAYAWLSLDQNLEISLATLTVFSAYL